jgi:oligo-1,6-glucosidase
MYDKKMTAWWKEAVIYQVYPRSFKDSDGDGIGDLRGIISKLDYIESLGVDTVWINPVYASPDTDNGYDISDFTAIQPHYGSMEDMDRLIQQLHGRNIRLIMDMVVNHTSDEHEWFRQARTGRDNPFYDFYIWWPEEKGQPPYRCGFFDEAGQGWQYNTATRSWYLHYFSPRQPDLNWDNPEVRTNLYKILRWWLDKGIDGFRMDAITFISKDRSFPPITPEILKEKFYGDWGHYYASGPRLHEYLRELHREVFSHYDAVAIAEAPGIRSQQALSFTGGEPREMDLICHFEGIMLGYIPGEFKKMDPAGYSVQKFKEIYTRWNDVFIEKGWGSLYLGNHDQPRMTTRWGNDSDPLRDASAKMLLTFLLTMRGTPLIYNGDELGMTNIRFQKIEEYRDIETHHMYKKISTAEGNAAAAAFLEDQQLAARDNSRTPFQWDDGPNAGFTTGRPWLAVNKNYRQINAAAQERAPGSVLQLARQLIRTRRQHPALRRGDYTLLNPEDPAVYAYTRSFDGERLLVILNMTKDEQRFFPGKDLRLTGVQAPLLNNYAEIRWMGPSFPSILLHPYQSLLFVVNF